MTDSTDRLLPAAARAPADRERFITFALTAADMLLEVSPDGLIEFAVGAFQRRFGESPEAWLGRPADRLVAMADRPAFDGAFSTLLADDRLPPTFFRLCNAAGTPVSVSGLRLPAVRNEAGRFCITVSALPKDAGRSKAVVRGSGEAALLRAAASGEVLSLIEVAAPPGGQQPPPGAVAALVEQALASALGSGVMGGELAAGRYGVVRDGGDGLAPAAIDAQLLAAVREAGLEGTVRSVPLQAEGLTAVQKSRALRFALDAFARGGHEGTAAAGFSDGLAGIVEKACSRAGSLRRAIEGNRFKLAFQPIVRIEDRSVVHYEALIRPDAEIAAEFGTPGDFVVLAEALGMSEALDWAVVEAASSAARRGRGARIAANLSGLSLQSPGFRARLLEHLDREPMLASRLMAEITETAEIEDEAEAVRTIAALRERGVTLCIDDFGAGAAAFRYLRAFRVDLVKIDGAYLQNAMRSEQDRGILTSMADLIRTVGARIVSERIETEDEAALMRSLGADYGQGWLYGRPGALP